MFAVVRMRIVNSTVAKVCRGSQFTRLGLSMVSRIYGLADARLSTPSAVRVGKHRMSGAVAQALWLRSQKNFHSFFPWALGMIPKNFQIEISEKKFGKKFPPRGVRPPNFLEKLKFGTKSSAPAKFGGDSSKTVTCSDRQVVTGQ